MSEPTYGSGQYDPQQGYGGQPSYGGQPYGGQPAAQQQPYQTGQQPQQPYGGGYGQQQPGGYQSGSYAASAPSTPKPPQDKLALAATALTIIGYVCAGIGVLGFILSLAVDGDGLIKFVNGLQLLALGLGLGGLNFAVGTWLAQRKTV
ncbi:MAG TPA: hypothetical protein VLM05_22195 [Mycobacteriales bacterium]|nr:hypothetical protein [Mycobacteriales bacterium]